MSEYLASRTGTATATGSAFLGVVGGFLLGFGVRRYLAEQEAIAAAIASGDNDAAKMGISAGTWVMIIFGILLSLVALGLPYARRDKGEAVE